MVEISHRFFQLACEWSGSKNARFSCLIVCWLLKKERFGGAWQKNHVFFILFQGAFWMLVSGRMQSVLQEFGSFFCWTTTDIA